MAPSLAFLTGFTSLTNISSSRHRPPSLTCQREEGWTESWGGKDKKENATDGREKSTKIIAKPSDFLGGEKNTNEVEEGTSIGLRLRQYRVAWREQIVLRMIHVPHIVENSSYAATETTGSLPDLLDLSCQSDGVRSNMPVLGEESNLNDHDVDQSEWGRAWKKSLSELNKPVLIGRIQPGGLGSNLFDHNSPEKATFHPSGSHIVDYLRLKYSHRMHSYLLFHEHLQGRKISGDAMAYETLIQDKLNYILLALRHGTSHFHGTNADNTGAKRKRLFPLWAWYQSFSERTLALRNLLSSTHGLSLELFRYNDYRRQGCSNEGSQLNQERTEDSIDEGNVHQHHPFSSIFPSYSGSGGGDTGKVNVHRALESADAIYLSLEEKLSDQCTTYFLGTEKPTYVDVLLFAHLAEALCDVHLILLLAKHSRLMKYFQWMHSKYFRSAGQGPDKSADWMQKNDMVNAGNTFNQLQEVDPSTLGGDGHSMTHAIQLMHKMAVHCNNLDEAIRNAAILRTAEGKERAIMENCHLPTGSRLYQWIMGSEVSFSGAEHSPKKTDTEKDGESYKESSSKEEDEKQRMVKEQMEKMKRDRRIQDELWLSGVAAVVVAVFAISASGNRRQ